MDEEKTSDLEFLNQLFESGNDQIRRTFDLYIELLDKLKEMQELNDGQDDSK